MLQFLIIACSHAIVISAFKCFSLNCNLFIELDILPVCKCCRSALSFYWLFYLWFTAFCCLLLYHLTYSVLITHRDHHQMPVLFKQWIQQNVSFILMITLICKLVFQLFWLFWKGHIIDLIFFLKISQVNYNFYIIVKRPDHSF